VYSGSLTISLCMTDGGGSGGCSACIGIFKTLLNRSTFIVVHQLLKSGRSGEQYPFLLLLLMNDCILFRSVALAKNSQALDA